MSENRPAAPPRREPPEGVMETHVWELPEGGPFDLVDDGLHFYAPKAVRQVVRAALRAGAPREPSECPYCGPDHVMYACAKCETWWPTEKKAQKAPTTHGEIQTTAVTFWQVSSGNKCGWYSLSDYERDGWWRRAKHFLKMLAEERAAALEAAPRCYCLNCETGRVVALSRADEDEEDFNGESLGV